MTERARREWPLVIFTIALQCACGMSVASALVGPSVRLLAVSIFPVIIVGLLASLLHPGRPLAGWRALRNLRHSRLSREIVLTSLFALAALLNLVYDGAAAAIVTAALGVAAVVSSAMLYVMPSQPFWNSGWLPLSFVATAMLVGGIVTGVAGVEIMGASLLLLSAVWMVRRLARVHQEFDSDPVEVRHPLLERGQRLCLAAHLLLVGVLPLLLAFYGLGRAWPVSLAAVLIGAAMGRVLMYSLAESTARG